MKGYLFLAAGWIAYFFLHSFLATTKMRTRFPSRPYRIFFIGYSVLGLLGLLFLNGSIKADTFFDNRGVIKYISLMLTTFGVMIIQSSFRQYSFKGFIGLADEKTELRTDGILGYIRHPIYAGTILVAVGLFFFIPNLPTVISCVCVFLYLPVGMYLEERKMLEAFGDLYREYRKKVPALIPGFN